MAKMMLVNPRKRKRKSKKTKRKSTRLARTTKRTVTTKRYRRNPIKKKGIMGILQNTVMPSAIAAGGAVGLDVIMGYLPIPATLKTGPMRHLAKGAGAIGMGMLASMFLKPKTAELITTGALTVVMHDAGKGLVTRFAPNIRLSSVDDELESLAYMSPGMVMGDAPGMDGYLAGYVESGPELGEYEMGEYDLTNGMGVLDLESGMGDSIDL